MSSKVIYTMFFRPLFRDFIRPSASTLSTLVLSVLIPSATHAQTAVISPQAVSVHAGSSYKFSVAVSGAQNPSGAWYVAGGYQNGVIDGDGTYHAPNAVPSPSTIAFGFIYNGSNNSTSSTLTITNPVPVVTHTNPSTFTQLSFPMLIVGSLFIPGATVTIQGTTYTPVYNDSSQLYIPSVTLTTPPINGSVAVTITNPDPGTSSTAFNVPSTFPGLTAVSPSTLPLGWSTVSVTGTGFTSSSVVTRDGRPLQTTFVSSTALTGYGYEPAWKTGSAVIGVIPKIGSPSESNQTLPVATALIPYNTAARFATQAGMGPRPDLVEHIQKIGLAPFLLEQMNLPGVAYIPNETPRLTYLHAALGSAASVLRMRVAAALNSYIPNQAIFLEYQSFVPWEQKLESDVTGNYRQILTDITADPRLGLFLSNAGNDVSATNPNLHPTQNFARELMQLFSLGTNLLNDDGSFQLDSTGQPLPAYDQNTVLDLSRALTGWDLPTPVNPAFTAFNIDESQVLTPVLANHDQGSKTLFGTTTLPAGQTVTQDRDQALTAIFNHPNLPPFVVQILIHHLVTSNPSAAYIKRVVTVFKNNGKGVRGDMSAVIAAILLDKEARAGDTKLNAADGFLQDPQLFQLFTISALQNPGTDGQPVYMDANLGQDWWYVRTVFDFYPQAALIPGTTINSPEFTLFNNLSALERTQLLYGMVTGSINGFGSEYQANSWLFNAFTNVTDLVTGLNHLLYHGQMSAAEQTAIINYCNGISNQNQAFASAIFLALNADGNTVTH